MANRHFKRNDHTRHETP